MTEQTLRKDRAVQTRVTEIEGERLERIAQIEGCSVADLARRALRQAFPQAFLLPADGTIGAVVEQNGTNGRDSEVGNTPINGDNAFDGGNPPTPVAVERERTSGKDSGRPD